MATTAKGFDQTLNETDWARVAPHLGAPWSIESGITLDVNTTTRARIVVAAGSLVAHGVRVVVDTDEVIDFTVPTSGTRYDMLAARINWETNTAAIIVVTGGSTKALPNGRQATPGVTFDVPLALAQLQAGENRIISYEDLRVRASKTLLVDTPLALPAGLVGGRARVGDIPYINPDGNAWSIDPASRSEWLLTKPETTVYTSASVFDDDPHLRVFLKAGTYVFRGALLGRCATASVNAISRIVSGAYFSESFGLDPAASSSNGPFLTRTVVDGDASIEGNQWPWGTNGAGNRGFLTFSGQIVVTIDRHIAIQHKKRAAGSNIEILKGSWLSLARVPA